MTFNDRSSLGTLLATRRSGKARDLTAPGPDPAELDRMLHAAIRVPDHGKLSPWRLVVVPADRRARFARLLADALAVERGGAAATAELNAAVEFAHAAPALVAVLSVPVAGHKVPVWEQELSVGAAIMNLIIAAHDAGYVANWLTTWAATSPTVVHALGGGGEGARVAGFIFIGSPARPLDERVRPDPQAVISQWQG